MSGNNQPWNEEVKNLIFPEIEMARKTIKEVHKIEKLTIRQNILVCMAESHIKRAIKEMMEDVRRTGYEEIVNIHIRDIDYHMTCLKLILKESRRKKAIFKTKKNNCPICFKTMRPKDTANWPTCTHTFHAKCTLEWLKRKVTCPMCRKSYHAIIAMNDSDNDYQTEEEDGDPLNEEEQWRHDNFYNRLNNL